MDLELDTKYVKSPYVEHIQHMRFTADGEMLLTPDGFWDIAILHQHGQTMILRTGLTTVPVTLQYEAGDSIVVISFKPHVYMPLMPGQSMRDVGVMLPRIGTQKFWIGTDAFEVPSFENADEFVNKLAHSQLLETNDAVASILAGSPKAMSTRSLQRHFVQTTGLTYKYFTQIERAKKAASLLAVGRPAIEVAFALGYTDQPHMIKSLKYILGQTPASLTKKV